MAHPYCTPAEVKTKLPHLEGHWGTGKVPDAPELMGMVEENDDRLGSRRYWASS